MHVQPRSGRFYRFPLDQPCGRQRPSITSSPFSWESKSFNDCGANSSGAVGNVSLANPVKHLKMLFDALDAVYKAFFRRLTLTKNPMDNSKLNIVVLVGFERLTTCAFNVYNVI